LGHGWEERKGRLLLSTWVIVLSGFKLGSPQSGSQIDAEHGRWEGWAPKPHSQIQLKKTHPKALVYL